MMAEPKARSQGSNGAGGGALAFTAISAANVEPAVIASTAAAKTSFFMTIPIAFKKTVGPHCPQGPVKPTATKFRNQSETWHPRSEAKKTSICRLFRRYGHS